MLPKRRSAPPDDSMQTAQRTPAADDASGKPRATAQDRLRRGVYLAFLAAILSVLMLGWFTSHRESQRVTDTALLERVSALRMDAQQIGRSAALIQAQPSERSAHRQELQRLVTAAGAAGRSLEEALNDDLHSASAKDAPLREAFAKWQQSQGQLRDRAAGLLRWAEARGTAPADGAADELVNAVQASADPAAATSQALLDALRDRIDRRAQQMRLAAWVLTGVTITILLLVMATVVEPMIRRLASRVTKLRDRMSQFRRLALVAEHTAAIVLITDRQDRIRWVNGGFTRLTGWTLDDARYAPPAELLRHPHTDERALKRMRDAVAGGTGARIESLFKRHDGEDLWLDIDLRPLRNRSGTLKGFVYVATDVGMRISEQAQTRLLWLSLPAGVIVQSAEGDVIDANHAAEQMLGLSRAQLIGQEPVEGDWHFVRTDQTEYPLEQLPAMRTLESGQPLRNQPLGVHLPSGNFRWLLANTEPQFDHRGEISAVVTCFSDVTSHRVKSAAGGAEPAQPTPAAAASAVPAALASAAAAPAVARVEATAPVVAAPAVPGATQIAPVVAEALRPGSARASLPGRAAVMDRVQRNLAHARLHDGYGFAVMFLEFDRLREVTEALSAGATDDLLAQISERLQRVLRPGDAVAHVDARSDMAARLSGDEFVLVLDGITDTQRVKTIAERLLGELSEPYTVLAHPVRSALSMGVVLSSGAEESVDTLMRNGDTALYEAKRAGRGRWVLFDNSMHQRVVRTLAMENDLKRALAQDELLVVYQPVVELRTGRLASVEALVRWHHPERGVVPPTEFIGVAEETGLIEAIGRFVLRSACRQFMEWRKEMGNDAPAMVSVNLAQSQLSKSTLIADVKQALRDTGMPVAALQLEVTESLAAHNQRVQATLRELKALGVRLALDDFGTGYSSLAGLHQLPVDTVKIDRSFVRHAETLEYHRVLIEATIRVARALGMITVAEGIETDGQAALLEKLSCDRGQGWLYSKAMEGDQLPRWVYEQLSLRRVG